MSLPATNSPLSRSWKDIRQGVNPRAMSKEGRRRRIFAAAKLVTLCVVGVGVAWAGLEVYLTWESNPARLKDAGPSVPLKQVVFSADGVLDRAWLDQTLALPKNASLMTLDLAALQARLLASGQVQAVVLRRRFTDNTLMVTVQERTPVARLMVQVGNASPRPLLVARDGVVFEGVGYGPAAVDLLPWLDGVQLRRTQRHGFEPIAGLDRIATLLTAAQGLVPDLCAGWQVLSLARFASDQEIIVRSHEISEIIFDARVDVREDFPRQLARLNHIVEFLRARGAPPMQRVNFALGGQVPVELQDTASSTPARSLRPKPATQPKQRRDF
jgi:cell division septal protein FtsQ